MSKISALFDISDLIIESKKGQTGRFEKNESAETKSLQTRGTALKSLNRDIFAIILEYLTLPELRRCDQVSKIWQRRIHKFYKEQGEKHFEWIDNFKDHKEDYSACLKNLRYLNLSHQNLLDKHFRVLARFENIIYLDLSHAELKITKKKNLSQVRYLNMRSCVASSSNFLNIVGGCSKDIKKLDYKGVIVPENFDEEEFMKHRLNAIVIDTDEEMLDAQMYNLRRLKYNIAYVVGVIFCCAVIAVLITLLTLASI